MKTKKLPTIGVLGVYTGVCLSDNGLSEIQEVMDHFYPGIMPIGCAMMGPAAGKEIERQIPSVAEIPYKPPVAKYVKAALKRFGKTMELSGPLGEAPDEIVEIRKRKPDAKIIAVVVPKSL